MLVVSGIVTLSIMRPYACGKMCVQGRVYSGQGMQMDDPEDKHVFLRYFSANGMEPILRSGTYVEMGAHNGAAMSNTHWLECNLGWRGVLIEPDKAQFAKLTALRGQPKLSNHLFPYASGCMKPGLIGIDRKGPQSRTNLTLVAGGATVECRPLSTMLSQANVTHINLFSLDVEGFELQVLRSMNWASTHVDVLVIELSERGWPNATRTWLRGQGMRRVEPNMGFGNEVWLGPNFEPPMRNDSTSAAPAFDSHGYLKGSTTCAGGRFPL